MPTPTEIEFILAHLDDDLPHLVLSAGQYPGIPVARLAGQIAALRKLRDKAPSWFDPALELPPLLSVEQASSEPTALFKAGLVQGKLMADLTGGMGIDAFFFARHFEQLVYVEQNEDLVALARHNFAVKKALNVEVVQDTAAHYLEASQRTFDLIYLDPARRNNSSSRLFRLADCSPDVPALLVPLMTHSSTVLLKTSPMLDLQSAIQDLKHVVRIWIVALKGEVKEVLYLLKKNASIPIDAIPVEAVNLESGHAPFVFNKAEEQASEPVFSQPQQYLYEPNAAILKAGAFRTFGARFNLNKLHPHTHLYTSEQFFDNVPGRCFRIDAVCKYDRKAVLSVLPSAKANVATRNFTDSAEQVRKKIGLADGGEVYLFGVTDRAGDKRILICKKV